MAISPKQLALSAEEIDIVRQYERIIDEDIVNEPVQPERTIKSSLFSSHSSQLARDLTRRVAFEIIRRYKVAGWTDCILGEGFVTLVLEPKDD
jgi:hypothetical protein